MRARIDLSKVDFRTTPVENIFLDTFLGQASGAAIKVYLYGWRHCLNEESVHFDVEELAENLNLTAKEVQDALNYWISEDLLSVETKDGEQTLTFRSTFLLWAGLTDLSESSAERVELPEEVQHREEEKKQMERKSMFDAIESYLSQGATIDVALKPDEIQTVNDVIDSYGLDPGFYLYAYKKACENNEANTRALPYVNRMIENWVRFEGVKDEATLDQYFEKREKIKKQKKTRRSTKKKTGEFVETDTRMTKEERSAWVKEKLERSRKANLRGDTDEGDNA